MVSYEVWAKELHDGSRAVVLFNRSEKEAEIGFSWAEIGMPQHLKFTVRDLWQHENMGKYNGAYSTKIPSHGVAMVIVK